MKVSIIVPTFNSGEFLEKVLCNLKVQTYIDKEIIVVDNFSTDNTMEIARRYADKVYQTGPERTAQANYGIKQAKGEVIYLTGSDMTRDYDYISQALEKLESGYAAVYASVLTDWQVTHFWGKVKALERECIIGTFIESARFFKKSVWEKLGGFDENVIALEEDFQHRLDSNGYKTAWIKAREYHLHEDDSLLKIFKKAFYYGPYMRSYVKKHKERATKQLSLNRVNLKPFLKYPALLFGLVVYKLVQYAGGGIGLLCG